MTGVLFYLRARLLHSASGTAALLGTPIGTSLALLPSALRYLKCGGRLTFTLSVVALGSSFKPPRRLEAQGLLTVLLPAPTCKSLFVPRLPLASPLMGPSYFGITRPLYPVVLSLLALTRIPLVLLALT